MTGHDSAPLPKAKSWWTGHSCPRCNEKVSTTRKHGHYTYHPDTTTVTVRHTIRACPLNSEPNTPSSR